MHGIPYRMSYNILLGKIPIRQKQPGQETAGGVRKRLERLLKFVHLRVYLYTQNNIT